MAGGPATWAARVAALRPELAADTGRALLTTWNDDPWAGASYTAHATTSPAGTTISWQHPQAGFISPGSTLPERRQA